LCENEKSRLPFIKIHILYNLLVELYHHEGLTRGHIDTPEKLELNIKDQGAFFERWSDKICIDQCYCFDKNL
jgi:hypothetical protein